MVLHNEIDVLFMFVRTCQITEYNNSRHRLLSFCCHEYFLKLRLTGPSTEKENIPRLCKFISRPRVGKIYKISHAILWGLNVCHWTAKNH